MTRPLRIAQVAPPLEPVPPRGYGGTERIIDALLGELVARGHAVTTFASGDSVVPGEHVVTVPRALRPAGFRGDPSPFVHGTIRAVLQRARDFDVIHSHLESGSVPLALASPTPVVSTFHGRLDLSWAAGLLEGVPGLVAISASQAAAQPGVRWAGIVSNGLALAAAPCPSERGDHLVFVGRLAAEKGVTDAIAVARRTGRPIRIVAKRPALPSEHEYVERAYLPAVRAAGSLVEDLGELSGDDRDRVVAGAHALLMPGDWPEPFGLTAIEALACGTPVIARPAGALPEIVRHGIDGFLGRDVDELAGFVDRVGEIDRFAIRASVIERFSAARMADAYEAVYRRVLAETAVRRAASAVPVERATPDRPPVGVGPGLPSVAESTLLPPGGPVVLPPVPRAARAEPRESARVSGPASDAPPAAPARAGEPVLPDVMDEAGVAPLRALAAQVAETERGTTTD